MHSKQQLCNSPFRMILRAATAALAIAFVLAFIALQAAMFPGTAYAQTVTFTFNLSCNVPNCPPENLSVATGVGGVASDTVPIATVNSDIPGYTQPVPINGGSLSWVGTPATWADCLFRLESVCFATYGNPGGSASITGSVFGLPNGSTLLTASFFGGAKSSLQTSGGDRKFTGTINISNINPVVLANLGMAGLPNHGTGLLYDELYRDPSGSDRVFTVSVTFTAGVGTFNVLHNFTNDLDGSYPYAGLIMDKAGNLYGTTTSGGAAGYGTVFRLTSKGSGWVFTPLYSFQGGNDGANPEAKVTIGPDGSLYGTTQAGGGSGCGGSGCGTVFRLAPSPTACTTALCPWTETVLYRFTGGSDGAFPVAEVVFDHAGNLYGTTYSGGQYNNGTVFELTPSGSGWTEKAIYSFIGGTDGQNPDAGLVFDPAGNLYGVTTAGGQTGNGTVYQLTPSGSGWTASVLYAFQGGTDGSAPSASLVRDQAGNLYGTSSAAVYELSPANGGWAFSVLYTLTSTFPTGGVFLDAGGDLYGGNSSGGYYRSGSIFKLTSSNGSWTPAVIYQFTGLGDGSGPIGVVLDAKGNLYGTTFLGGSSTHGYGLVFEIAK